MSVVVSRQGFRSVAVAGAGDRPDRVDRAIGRALRPRFLRIVDGTQTRSTHVANRSRHVSAILAALREYEYGLTAADLADLLQLNAGHVNCLLMTMRARDEISYAGDAPVPGNHSKRTIVWRIKT